MTGQNQQSASEYAIVLLAAITGTSPVSLPPDRAPQRRGACHPPRHSGAPFAHHPIMIGTAMIKVSVMYPHNSGARFDHDYYRDRHMPLVPAPARRRLLFLYDRQGVVRWRGGKSSDLCGHVPRLQRLHRALRGRHDPGTARRSSRTCQTSPISRPSSRSATSSSTGPTQRNQGHPTWLTPPSIRSPRKLVKEYPLHSAEQVEHALAAADAVFRSEWSQGPIDRRLAVLSKLADVLTERTKEFAPCDQHRNGQADRAEPRRNAPLR